MRSWYTPDGEILLEGRPLDGEAHEYLLLDAAGALLEASVTVRHDQRLTLLGVDESVLAAAHQHWDETADRAKEADALLAAAVRDLPAAIRSRLDRIDWSQWPVGERDAVDRFLHAAWKALLARYPAPAGQSGGFRDAAAFLRAVAPLYRERLVMFPQMWRAINPPAADRHLADLVQLSAAGTELPPPVAAWLRRPVVRGYLFLAYVRQREAPWSGTLLRAYEMLS
jgi:hypothetical protein